MIPVLYSPTETAFTSRGFGPLSDAVSCVVTEERNGSYEMEMQYPVTGRNYDEITERSIITAIPSPYRAPQPFRVYEIEAPMNGIVTIRARHISYDLSGVAVSPFTLTGDAQTVLNALVSNSVNFNTFSVTSDITRSRKLKVEVPSSFRSVLGGMDGSVLDKFHGEYCFDFFNVNLMSARGKDTKVRIAYGKNITDFKMTKDLDSVITAIYPYWTDGEEVLTLVRTIVPVYEGTSYSNILPVDLSDKFEEKPTRTQLLAAAEEYIEENDLTTPKVTFEVSFIDLASTKEYEGIAELEKVDLCDKVTVIFPMYGVQSKAKVIKVETNVLLERYNSVTIGTMRANIADTIANLEGAGGTFASNSGGGGGGGTNNYNELLNKPLINNVLLTGNKTLDELGIQPELTAGNMVGINSNVISSTIPFGKVDSTSTSTAFTATVPNVRSLENGVACYIMNGAVTSASGWTLNVNGLGAKPVFSSMSADTRITTTYNVNYTALFIYNTLRPSAPDGCWDFYYGYYTSSNSIGYQLRTNSLSLPMSKKTYRYRLLFTSTDNTKWVPANTSTATNATTAMTVNNEKINPFGRIVYFGTTSTANAGARPSPTVLWDQYVITLGYSFNTAGGDLTLTSWLPVYIKCSPQDDGSVIIDSTNPYVQSLPSTEDGFVYIYLGVAVSATTVEMTINHPIYWYNGGAVREWKGTTNVIIDCGSSTLNVWGS